MRTLAGYTLLYDAECPMCSVYTKAFVKAGMLDAAGRAPYQQMPPAACPLVDRQRAANEIALVNAQTGDVQYGIKSLFKVIGNALPIFKPLFNWQPFIWLMTKVYAFISYNRKVIIPAPAVPGSVQPTFKLGYRAVYLISTWLLTGFILSKYAGIMEPLVPVGHANREYLVCGGQILFQGLIISLVSPFKRWDYLGNMMTISFAGALLLVPGLLVAQLYNLPAAAFIVYFMLVAGLMLLEHLRRVQLLTLNKALSATWVLYRLLVLITIYYVS